MAKQTMFDAARRPEVESWLTERGFKWEFLAAVPADDFDYDACLRNQARTGEPLSEETVERYTTAIANGEILPAVVAAPAGAKTNAKLVTVDGNHRLTAFRAKSRFVPAYVIRGASQAALISATMEANTRHGMALSEADRMHHAMWYLDNGMDLNEVARRTGLSRTSIRRANKLIEATGRADDVGILRTRWEALNPYIRERLATISTDEAFKPLAELCLDAKLTTSELNRLATAINAIRSTAQQVQFVQQARETEFADRIGTRGLRNKAKRGGQQTPRQRMAIVLGLAQVLPPPEAIVATVLPDEARALAELVDTAIETFGKIHLALIQKVDA